MSKTSQDPEPPNSGKPFVVAQRTSSLLSTTHKKVETAFVLQPEAFFVISDENPYYVSLPTSSAVAIAIQATIASVLLLTSSLQWVDSEALSAVTCIGGMLMLWNAILGITAYRRRSSTLMLTFATASFMLAFVSFVFLILAGALLALFRWHEHSRCTDALVVLLGSSNKEKCRIAVLWDLIGVTVIAVIACLSQTFASTTVLNTQRYLSNRFQFHLNLRRKYKEHMLKRQQLMIAYKIVPNQADRLQLKTSYSQVFAGAK